MKRTNRNLAVGVIASLAVAGWIVANSASMAFAAVIETDSTQSGTAPFTPSYTVAVGDILLGRSPTAVAPSASAFTEEGAGGIPVLTDGVFGTITGVNGSNPAFATAGGDGGTSLTYTLAQPYTLTSIITLGGWNDSGRDVQSYTVSYGVGGVFTPLTTVNYNPGGGGTPTASQVTLNGFSILDVTAIKFDFNNAPNGHQGYAELTAFGTPTPEPASFALFGLGAIGLAFAARRRLNAKNLTKIAVVLAVLVCSAVPSLAASISGFDPTFETPAESSSSFTYNATGAFTSTSGIISPPSGFSAPAAPQGSQVGFLQTNTSDSHYNGLTNGLITGSINGLLVGKLYNLSGLEAARGGASPAFSVTVGGNLVGSESPASTSSYNSFTTSTFVATATSESLLLLSTAPGDSTTFIDQLTVSQIAPEPSSILLCGLGAIGLLLAARRRRQA